MAHKENQKAFVITFPLRTEKWQEDRIDKMMRLLTTFYNDRQRKLVRRYIYLSHSKAYKEAKGKGVVAFKNYMKENGFYNMVWMHSLKQTQRGLYTSVD